MFFVIGLFCIPILFVLTLASEGAVLYGCYAFNCSTFNYKTVLSFFKEKVFVFQNFFKKVKVLKTLNFHCHIKNARNPQYRFLDERMLFLLALKWNL